MSRGAERRAARRMLTQRTENALAVREHDPTTMRAKNLMLQGQGSNVSPQDRGSWQGAAQTSSNPYYQQNYIYRYQEWVRWYYTCWLARKIVDIPVYDSWRIPFRITGLDDPVIEKLMKEWNRLKATRKFMRAGQQQRLFGGCLMYLGVADARQGKGGTPDRKVEQPIDPERIDGVKRALRCVNVIDIIQVSRSDSRNDNLAEDYDADPQYMIQGRLVHPSRIIAFDGDPLLNRQNMFVLMQNHYNPTGFNESVLTPLYDDMVRATGSAEGAYHLVNMASVLLAAVKDLKILGATQPGEANLAAIAEIMRSINLYRGAMVDANSLEMKNMAASFGSVPELLMSFLQIVSAAGDIPATRFLGQAPGGLNATGASDLENYYDTVDAHQVEILKPRQMKMFDLIGTTEYGLDQWADMRPAMDIEYPPLWNASETEQATVGKTWIQGLSGLVTSGIMTEADMEAELKAREIFKTDVHLQARAQAVPPAGGPSLTGGAPAPPFADEEDGTDGAQGAKDALGGADSSGLGVQAGEGAGGAQIGNAASSKSLAKTHLDKIGAIDIYAVDGGEVKTTFCPDFVEGGHWLVYDWIPENEVWIDGNIDASQWPHIARHELAEIALMKGGMSYDEAHPKANAVEVQGREEEKQ